MKRFQSNGKLLLTGEYLVLDGATALAVPTKFGQDLTVHPIEGNQLVWSSFTVRGECWFEAIFELPKIRLVNATFNSNQEGSNEFIAETLQGLLQEAKNINSDFLNSDQGLHVKTHLTFPRDWGLGSSSTLINNIAQWADVDAFTLLWNAFSGSGYDIACAMHDTPILYRLENKKPIVDPWDFTPSFKEQLFFVYLNQKQNSREGIQRYREQKVGKEQLDRISDLTFRMANAKGLPEFEFLIRDHEDLISSIIGLQPVKEKLFSDYFGELKSLGAWGGDFVLATGNEHSPGYFKQKGFPTVLTYSEMVL